MTVTWADDEENLGTVDDHPPGDDGAYSTYDYEDDGAAHGEEEYAEEEGDYDDEGDYVDDAAVPSVPPMEGLPGSVADEAPAPPAPRPPARSSGPRVGKRCPDCGSYAVELHDASGASICTECGAILEESAIVSSVEFSEGDGGGPGSMIGTFVGAGSRTARPSGGGAMGGGGARYGMSRESREATLAAARRRIQDVAIRLRLGGEFVDTAHRLYTVAIERNFVMGRRSSHVTAACLYIACRQRKSQHMLIDFSDALQVNVYTLGTCFLKFRRLLSLRLEIVDPALYVYRFAAHLDLGVKANAVALTALRIVGRMKRDWLVAGRRPAGICAAALLIASRAHGFGRSQRDVARILRVCGVTVQTRLKEFEATPSSRLSLDQFQTMEIGGEADPPAYTRNKLREARQKAIMEGRAADAPLLIEGPAPKGGGRRKRNKKKMHKNDMMRKVLEGVAQEIIEEGEDDGTTAADVLGTDVGADLAERAQEEATATTVDEEGQSTDLVVADGASPDAATVHVQLEHETMDLSEWNENIPPEIAATLGHMFRGDGEAQEQEAIFNSMNAEYLEKAERKRMEAAAAERAGAEDEDDERDQTERQARLLHGIKKKRKGKKPGLDGADGPQTAEEALLAAVSQRRVSRKINYDAMSSIFGEDGGFVLDGAEGSAGDAAQPDGGAIEQEYEFEL